MGVLSYTPSHCPVDLLEALTTGEARRITLDRLVLALKAEIGLGSHQHQLVLGPRGSGKTHLLTLVRARLMADEAVNQRLWCVALAEEEVARQPADLLIRILKRLAGQVAQGSAPSGLAAAVQAVTSGVLARLASERDHARALELAADALGQIAAKSGRLLIAVVENLDSLLYAGPGGSRVSKKHEHWALRDVLQRSKGLLLLAAAPTRFSELGGETAAFHGFFRVHELDELTPDEVIELFRKRLQAELAAPQGDPQRQHRLLTLKAGFDGRVPTLRGLLAYTGGLPRFAHLVFDVLLETEATSAYELLTGFLDEQTPYFQTRLDPRQIPDAELEVLDALASARGPLRTAELTAELRGVSAPAVAENLKRLRERGLVRERRGQGRAVYYDVAEPLFRVWRRFRLGPSEEAQIVALAEFVAALFPRVELLADRALLPESAARALPGRLLDAVEIDQALGQVAPAISERELSDEVRERLLNLVLELSAGLGAAHGLDLLPRLEAALPASRAELLRPARLALEVLVGKRDGALPSEPEEVRRAVEVFFGRLDERKTLSSAPRRA